MTGREGLEKIADQKEITLTKGQLKELMREAAQTAAHEAVEKYKREQGKTPELTKEQILNTRDGEVRRRLISQNRHLFS